MLEILVVDDFVSKEWDGCTHGEKVVHTIKKYTSSNGYSIRKCNIGLPIDEINKKIKMSDKLVDVLELDKVNKADIVLLCIEIKGTNPNARKLIAKISKLLASKKMVIVAKSNINEEYCIPYCMQSVIHIVGGFYLYNQYNIESRKKKVYIRANSFPEFIDVNGRITCFSGISKSAAIVIADIINIYVETNVMYTQDEVIKLMKCNEINNKYVSVDCSNLISACNMNIKKLIRESKEENERGLINMNVVEILEKIRKKGIGDE